MLMARSFIYAIGPLPPFNAVNFQEQEATTNKRKG